MSVIKSARVIFQDAKRVPAKDNYPEQTTVTVVDEKMTYHLTSQVVDLSTLPVLEPCSFEATIERFGGKSGYFIVQCSAVTVASLSAPVVAAVKK